jgi:hypothetical protein
MPTRLAALVVGAMTLLDRYLWWVAVRDVRYPAAGVPLTTGTETRRLLCGKLVGE